VPERHTRLPSRQPLIVYSGGIHRSVTAAAEISVKNDRWAAQQGVAHLPLGAGVQRFEKIDAAAGELRDRYSIADTARLSVSAPESEIHAPEGGVREPERRPRRENCRRNHSEAPRKHRGFVAWMANLGLPCPARGQRRPPDLPILVQVKTSLRRKGKAYAHLAVVCGAYHRTKRNYG